MGPFEGQTKAQIERFAGSTDKDEDLLRSLL
jgi:hypothetical protein